MMTQVLEADPLTMFEVDDPASGVAHLGLSRDACKVYRARDEQHWLSTKSFFGGASEIAALFGLCPPGWKKTALSLYLAKTRVREEETAEEQAEREDRREYLELGKDLEPGVANICKRRLKVGVVAPPEWSTFQSAKVPFIGATPDRFTVEIKDGDEGTVQTGVLELKTADYRRNIVQHWRKNDVWTVPLHYQAQVQQQMFVLGVRRARLALLIGRKFLSFDIEYDDKFVAAMIEKWAWFWECVEKKTPPPATALDYDAVQSLYEAAVPGKVVDLGEEGANLLASIEAADEEIARWESQKDGDRARVAEMMADAERGRVPDGREFTNRESFRTKKALPEVVEALAVARATFGLPGHDVSTPEKVAIKRIEEILTTIGGDVRKSIGRVLQKPRKRSEK